MFVWPWVVDFVLRIGWKDKDVAWIVGICTICVRHLATTFEDNHCFLDTGVVMPVKGRACRQPTMGDRLAIWARGVLSRHIDFAPPTATVGQILWEWWLLDV